MDRQRELLGGQLPFEVGRLGEVPPAGEESESEFYNLDMQQPCRTNDRARRIVDHIQDRRLSQAQAHLFVNTGDLRYESRVHRCS